VKQIVNGGLTLAQFPDSVDIDRIDLATRKVDTTGYVKVQKQTMMITQTEKGMSVGMEINPVQTVDDWAVLSNGSIGIVRGLDYHVDIVSPSGTVSSGPKIPFAWRPLPDEEKLVVLDSAKRQVERQISGQSAQSMMAMHGGQVAGVAPRDASSPLPFRMVDPSKLPDYWPPFGQNAVKADADGYLWIRTNSTRPGAIGGPIYDVVDQTGSLVDRVQLAPGRTIAGFAKGGVAFLLARDGNGAWLERATVAASSAQVSADTSSSRFIGDWEGNYSSDHAGPGAMILAISRDKGVWKLSADRTFGGGIMSKVGTNVRTDGNDIYWDEELMNQPCKSSATLENGVLNGETACGPMKIGFTLKRKQK
jgi:hypothetical protein